MGGPCFVRAWESEPMGAYDTSFMPFGRASRDAIRAVEKANGGGKEFRIGNLF
jgi:hypothetical protein